MLGGVWKLVAAVFVLVMVGMVGRVEARVGEDVGDLYQHADGKWTVKLPAGWKVMPREMLSAMNAGAEELAARSGGKAGYVAGFFKGNALTGRWSWVLVQDRAFTGRGKLPRDLTKFLDVEGFKAEMTKMESMGVKTRVLSTIVDGENGKAVIEFETDVEASGEKVVGRVNMTIGSRSGMVIGGYAAKENWAEYERDVAEICSSAMYVGAHQLSAGDRAVEGEDLAYRMGQVVGTIILILVVIGVVKGVKKLRGG